MPFTPPTEADLAALEASAVALSGARAVLLETEARITLVRDRLAVEAPPPPPPDPALPAVGVGGSGAFGTLPRARRQEALALAKAAGCTHFRFDCQWAGIEYRQGQYGFANVVEKAQDVIAAGLIPMVLIGWPPSFYRQKPTAGGNSAPTVASLPAWERFLRALFEALYAVGVRRFEIWNEPNGLFMQPVIPELWADLVLIAHDVASDISRHIEIIAGGVCPRPHTPPTSMGARQFYEAVLAHEPHFNRFVSAVGIHPYSGDHTRMTDGKFWKEHVEPIRAMFPAEVPFCGTEHGWKSGRNTESERSTLYVDSIESMPDKRQPLYIFSLFDFAEPYGLVTSAANGFQPKPVYFALRDLLA